MLKWIGMLSVMMCFVSQAPGSDPQYRRALSVDKLYSGTVTHEIKKIHWQDGGASFWYKTQSAGDRSQYVKVDAVTGKMERSNSRDLLPVKSVIRTSETPSHRREDGMRSSHQGEPVSLVFKNELAYPVKLYWLDFDGHAKPYGQIAVGGSKGQNTFAGHAWRIVGQDDEVISVLAATEDTETIIIDGAGREEADKNKQAPDDNQQWRVEFKDHQIVIENRHTKERSIITQDGSKDRHYTGPVTWSPDGQSFVAFQQKQIKTRQVTMVESRPADQLQPKVHTFDYAKPGDELPCQQPVLVQLQLPDFKVTHVDASRCPHPFVFNNRIMVEWAADGSEVFFDYNQRGHQLYQILGLKRDTGEMRIIAEEESRTFIDQKKKQWRHWLHDTKELLWTSEQDGWNHLYLHDVTTGKVKTQITKGAWVLREVLRVDEAQRTVWFLASGLNPKENPYQQHLCRVQFDGSEFKQLTQGDGDHHIEFAPDGKTFIARWSRVDQPPVTELRRSNDGHLLSKLEEADISELLKTGWRAPERFTAKGRDGSTDIHGIIIKPSDFDPAKKYPVIERIYAGPHGSFTPVDFSLQTQMRSIAELSFIVVQCDGMGTNDRGKAFQDVSWKNLKDGGFPDRKAWIKAAAATRPWMDVSRVGIYGGSAGGHNAMRAVLDHADLYKVAVADCGCHDNRMDKLWWNEQWLGWPVDESYAANSNLEDAHKLNGRLLLVVGELDRNVDPASTMQVAHALQKANKNFELLVVAGAGHGANETPYASRKRMDFFVRHLLKVEPPEWSK